MFVNIVLTFEVFGTQKDYMHNDNNDNRSVSARSFFSNNTLECQYLYSLTSTQYLLPSACDKPWNGIWLADFGQYRVTQTNNMF